MLLVRLLWAPTIAISSVRVRCCARRSALFRRALWRWVWASGFCSKFSEGRWEDEEPCDREESSMSAFRHT